MHRSALKCRAARSGMSAKTKWILVYKILELPRSVEGHDHPQQLAVEATNERAVGSTQSYRAFGHRFKHRLKVECRAADDLKYLRRGILLLERLSKNRWSVAVTR